MLDMMLVYAGVAFLISFLSYTWFLKVDDDEPLSVDRELSTKTNKTTPTKNKKALLVGINYVGTRAELSGCVNDVRNVNKYLKENCDYNKFQLLTDEHTIKPTKSNILNGIDWLMKDVKSGDQLMFHYSGHGDWQKDDGKDEHDGKDECLVPLDYNRNGYITDDELHLRLVKPLMDRCQSLKDVRLMVIVDACHSGTILDLPHSYSCDKKMNLWRHSHVFDDNQQKMQILKKMREQNINIFFISGCEDHQTSADVTQNGLSFGALSNAFLRVMKNQNHKVPSRMQLITQMHEHLKDYTQKPQLGTLVELDMNKNFSLKEPRRVSVSNDVEPVTNPSDWTIDDVPDSIKMTLNQRVFKIQRRGRILYYEYGNLYSTRRPYRYRRRAWSTKSARRTMLWHVLRKVKSGYKID